MLTITKKENALIVKGTDNRLYPDNGTNSYPLNSISIVIDDSEIATFRSASNNDILFSGLISEITIGGEAVTKDNIIEKFDAVANAKAGGDVTTEQLEEVRTIAQEADTKADTVTSRIEDVETSLDDKQDALVSGANIKTVNGESILGEGNISIEVPDVDAYTKTEADNKFATITEINDVVGNILALTEWIGTQAEFDALTETSENITYYITE